MLYGNAYCKLDIKNSGRVSAIHPIQARFVQISWNREKREATYHVTDNPYNVAEDLSPYETLHIHGLSIDGIAGVNPNELWRESMATSIALERYTAAFFGQACRPSGVLKTAGQLSDKAKANLKESWKRTYTGTSQTGAVPVLEEGLEFEPMSSNNDEFQMIESKQNQVRQMANWCKISPTKCGDLSRATWSNLTEENRQFLMATLNPLLHKIEQEFSRKLLLPSERTTLSIEFDVSGLLRTDDATRYDNNIKACGGPFLTVNEVRAMENKQPVKGGDVLRTGLNQGDASKQDDSEQEPAPADNEATDDEQTKDAD
jgi:HK97 family phage portal protein